MINSKRGHKVRSQSMTVSEKGFPNMDVCFDFESCYYAFMCMCLDPSADIDIPYRKGLKDERMLRPLIGCCTLKLLTMLFWTSSSAEVKRRLRNTASWSWLTSICCFMIIHVTDSVRGGVVSEPAYVQ